MNTTWRTVRVFISSTFRDMQAERDHLVRFVFPRLSEELLARRIHFINVDLRWGVTCDQDALEVCREVVDECRPRFICMLGGRYGWVPPGKSRSITADEVYYGVLDCELKNRGYAYFYFRDDTTTASMVEITLGEFREPQGSDNKNKLSELKQAIVATGLNPFIYSAQWDNTSRRLIRLKEFGDHVYDDLLASMKADPQLRDRFVKNTAAQLNEFAEEGALMEAFVKERSEGFVLGSREPVLNELLAHASATGGNGYVCLTGAAGSGKTALLAHLSQHSTLNDQPSTLLIRHFVGASPGSTDVRRTLRRLCHELKARRADIPNDSEKLRVVFLDFLWQACKRQRVVILLDAVNQFDPTSHSTRLHWLPEELPENVHVILSTLDGPALEELRCHPSIPREIELQPFTATDGEAIIDQFRKRYRKQFEPDQRVALLNKTDAGTPLYLMAALEELRTMGTYEEITQCIADLPPTTHEIFAWIMERLENDDGFRDAAGRRVGRKLVSRFVALLGASRNGLSQRELADLLDPGDPQGNVAALLHLLRPYLMRRGELLDFYHGQFRTLAIQIYLPGNSERQVAHETLARYFRGQADPVGNESWKGHRSRPFRELTFHIAKSSKLSDLHTVLSDILFIQAKCLHGMAYELAEDLRGAQYSVSTSTTSLAGTLVCEALSTEFRRQLSWIYGRPDIVFQLLYNQAIHSSSQVFRDWASRARTRWEQVSPLPWLEVVYPEPKKALLKCRLSDVNDMRQLSDQCTINADGTVGIVSGMDGRFIWYNLENGRIVARWNIGGMCFGTCALAGHGGYALLALSEKHSRDQVGFPVQAAKLGIWDGKKNPKPFVELEPGIRRVAMASDDKRIAALTLSSHVWLLSAEKPNSCAKIDLQHYVPPAEAPLALPHGMKLPAVPLEVKMAMDFGASGRFLVVTSASNIVILDALDGQIVSTIALDIGPIDDCAASDSPYRICVVADGVVVLFDAEPLWNGNPPQLVAKMSVPHYRASAFSMTHACCAMPEDGSRIIAAMGGTDVTIWDWMDNTPRVVLKHSGKVCDLKCSRDGVRVMSLDHTGGYLWEVPKTASNQADEEDSNSIVSFSIDVEGNLIALGDNEGYIQLRHCATKQSSRLAFRHTGPVRVCLITDDGEHLITADDCPGLHIFRRPFERQFHVTAGLQKPICWAGFSPDGALLLTVDLGGVMHLWSTKSWTIVTSITSHENSLLLDWVFTPDGLNLLSIDAQGNLKKWTMPDGQLEQSISLGSDPAFGNDTERQLFVSLDGRVVYATSWQLGHVALDCVSLRLLDSFGRHKYVRNTLTCMARADRICAVGEVYGEYRHPLSLWGGHDLKESATLPGHSTEVLLCQSLPDGVHLLSGAEDAWIKIWNCEREQLVASSPVSAEAKSVKFDVSGHLIGIHTVDHQVRVYRFHLPSEGLTPTAPAWRHNSGRLFLSCVLCRGRLGFSRSIFPVDEANLGKTVMCPRGHRLWILKWPLGRIPLWCNKAYWNEFF